jgi:hypothetical protein
MRDKLVKIKDIERMARHLRKDIASQQAVNIKELKQFITQDETVSLIKQYSKKNDKGDLLVNTKILDKIFQEMYNWIVGIEISKLASKGVFDVYWNDEQNQMTFLAIDTKKEKE